METIDQLREEIKTLQKSIEENTQSISILKAQLSEIEEQRATEHVIEDAAATGA